MTQERDISPSPLRAGYIKSQRLNDINSLTYRKTLFLGPTALWAISNNASEESVFQTHHAFGPTDLPPSFIYGGLSVFDTGSGFVLAFPEGVIGTNFNELNLVVTGLISANIDGAILNFHIPPIARLTDAITTGTPDIVLSTQYSPDSSSNTEADDLKFNINDDGFGALRLETTYYLKRAAAATTDVIISTMIAKLTYNTRECPEITHTTVRRDERTLGLPTITNPLALKASLNWNTASSGNFISIDGTSLELL